MITFYRYQITEITKKEASKLGIEFTKVYSDHQSLNDVDSLNEDGEYTEGVSYDKLNNNLFEVVG